jgi:hypothetical protein
MTLASPTSTQERALALLGQGIGPEVVASAVGVSVSYISQLLSEQEFAEKVSILRYENLAKHNIRDAHYDELENKLVEKMEGALEYMVRPLEILKAIQIINSAKRRGSSAPETIMAQKEVVSLIMPIKIVQNFTTNVNNQVIQAGTQELITVQSGAMNDLVAKRANTSHASPSGSSQNHVQQLPYREEGGGASR